jgi:hypothetical protein
MHEPPHIHIDRDSFSAKFWLNLVALAYNLGFPARELSKLETLTVKNQENLLEEWNEYLGA